MNGPSAFSFVMRLEARCGNEVQCSDQCVREGCEMAATCTKISTTALPSTAGHVYLSHQSEQTGNGSDLIEAPIVGTI